MPKALEKMVKSMKAKNKNMRGKNPKYNPFAVATAVLKKQGKM